MPHIHAIFPDLRPTRDFLQRNKLAIRQALSAATGYELGEIALIPEPISWRDKELSDNVMDLEFVADAGTKVTSNAVAVQAETMKKEILLRCPEADKIHFGIWLKGHQVNEFIEHKPS